MRALFVTFGWLALTASAAFVRAEDAATLEALKQQIVGLWKHEHRQFGVEADTLKTYAADGSYSATSTVRIVGTTSVVNYEGKWEILAGPVLRLTVTKTDNRVFVPMGEVYVMEDFEIEDDVMTYTHDDKANREDRQEAEADEE